MEYYQILKYYVGKKLLEAALYIYHSSLIWAQKPISIEWFILKKKSLKLMSFLSKNIEIHFFFFKIQKS